MNDKRTIKFDVVTISDRCFRKETTDNSGPLLLKLTVDYFENLNINVESQLHLIPDDIDNIKQLLVYLCDEKNVSLILTTGGTGVSPADVTPEATSQIAEKLVPGISTLMLMDSLKFSKHASLSRAICAIRKNSLIVNFPGSVKAVKECFESVCDCLLHAIDLITNNLPEINKIHYQTRMDSNELKNDPIARSSPYEMISLEDAKVSIENEALSLQKVVSIPLSFALNCVTADDIYSSKDVPLKDCSLKDGFAVKAPISENTTLSVINELELDSYEFQPHNCYKISTGHFLPPHTNSVVPIENTLLHETNSSGVESLIDITRNVSPCEEIRYKGSDIAKNQLLIKSSTQLLPEHLALLASAFYVPTVRCYKIPTIGVFSTGDEIVDPIHCDIDKVINSNDLIIMDSNRLFLINKLTQLGFTKVIDGGIVKDDYDEISNKISVLSEQCDVIISSGSASMGEKDYVKRILVNEFDAEIHFGRINLKPGKPTSFATFSNRSCNSKVLFFSLPGNPVSCSVMFHVLVKDALFLMCNRTIVQPIKIKSKIPIVLSDSRPECYRCTYDRKNNLAIPLCKEQQSSRLLSICGADLLILLPGKTDEVSEVSNKTELTAYLI